MTAVEELVKIARNLEHEELQDSIKAASGHIAGYLVRSATRNNKCGACADRLCRPLDTRFEDGVLGLIVSICRSFTELLGRGKLLIPSCTEMEVKPGEGL